MGEKSCSSEWSDRSVDNPEDVALFHDQKVFAVDLDLGPGPLAEQHAVASLHVQRNQLAGLIASARANGNDLAFLGLFLGAVGNDDAALGLFFAFETPFGLLRMRVQFKRRQIYVS